VFCVQTHGPRAKYVSQIDKFQKEKKRKKTRQDVLIRPFAHCKFDIGRDTLTYINFHYAKKTRLRLADLLSFHSPTTFLYLVCFLESYFRLLFLASEKSKIKDDYICITI
jgi:hypothetical protein